MRKPITASYVGVAPIVPFSGNRAITLLFLSLQRFDFCENHFSGNQLCCLPFTCPHTPQFCPLQHSITAPHHTHYNNLKIKNKNHITVTHRRVKKRLKLVG